MASSKLIALPANPTPSKSDLIYNVPAAGGADYKMTVADLLGLSDLVISESGGKVTVTTKAGKSLEFKSDTDNIDFNPAGYVYFRKVAVLWETSMFGYSAYSLKTLVDPATAKFALSSDGKYAWTADAGNATAAPDAWLVRAAAGVVAVGAGQKLQVGDNAVAETPTATHTLRLRDAAGVEYRVLAIPV